MLFQAPSSPYLVPFGGMLRLAERPTAPPEDAPGQKKLKKRLAKANRQLSELQKVLYAHDRFGVLLVFQALDAAGKDSTIRSVLSGVNPAGCQVYSFKRPSNEELDHEFLWRSSVRLPERGRIGVFNRSYYEEVLVVKVHEDLLDHQKLPPRGRDELWSERYDSIAGLEQHLARNGTVVLKFFLNVSKEEQRRRFLARLDAPEKNWKFELGDVKERGHFEQYGKAYEQALNATSRSWAPWYTIPADDKPFMRTVVAELVVESLESLPLEFPSLSSDETARLGELRAALESEAPAEQDDARRCIHAGECVRGLPAVFDPARRPWVVPDEANPDEVADVVRRCPTGALRFERAGGPDERPPSQTSINVSSDGPLILRGDLRIVAGGERVSEIRAALCRCGLSEYKPYCDGSHKERFRDSGQLGKLNLNPPSDVAPAATLQVTTAPNGPLLLDGPFELRGSEGVERAPGMKAALCRCGQSANKPFCDGSHKSAGFEAD